jgi:glutamate racemase
MMKIGVFDSGVGGLSVANAIRKSLPELEIVVREDKEHVPYGTRRPEEILGSVRPIFQEMIDEGCQIIVIACNTVSTTLVPKLREEFKVPLIAVEPMVKYAAKLTRSGTIAVCATPTTLASPRYAYLKRRYAKDLTVLEPDCSDWARMIQDNEVNEGKIRARIETALDGKADVIVLGCTHYHWIEQEIKDIAAGRAQVIQPEPIVVQQLRELIAQPS